MNTKMYQVIFAFKNEDGDEETYYSDPFNNKKDAEAYIKKTIKVHLEEGQPDPTSSLSIHEMDFIVESTEVLYGLKDDEFFHEAQNN